MKPTASVPDAVASAFSSAENAIKMAERVSLQVAIPAVNQLRYALGHVLDGAFDKAVNHCLRAKFDAYEAAIGYYLLYIHNASVARYPQELLDRHLPKWPEYRKILLDARDVLQGVRSVRNADEKSLRTLESTFTTLQQIVRPVDEAQQAMFDDLRSREESELAARERAEQDRVSAVSRENDRRYYLSFWITVLGSLLSALGLVLTIISICK